MIAPGTGFAHETRPAIADISISQNQVSIEITVTLEALVAGLDLTEISDTNDSPLSSTYDALRHLSPEKLGLAFQDSWPSVSTKIHLFAGNKEIDLAFPDVHIGPIEDVELARDSQLSFLASLPNDGTKIQFGWDKSFGPLIVRQILTGSDGYTGYLTNGDLSAEIPRQVSGQTTWPIAFWEYIKLGFEHIVPKGLDHILFVLGLFFFSNKFKPLFHQVSAFTLAHTVTLALAILGVVQVSAQIVEPLIAASIVYVAVENIRQPRDTRWRLPVVFGFGLLHGLGFASVLGEIGLVPGRFISGLIGFNIGVELGQLFVLAAAYLLVGYLFFKKDWYRKFLAIPASVAIAITGAFWFVERLVG